MKNRILELEKSLFKQIYMNDIDYLNNIIHDKFMECGKSGKFFYKNDTIQEFLKLDSDRDITIYNYTCEELNNTYLVHYITKSGNDLIYRTSIWIMAGDLKLYFHQASKLNVDIELIEY